MSHAAAEPFAPRPVLQNVQALRGVAVVMVMFGHILAPADFPWIEGAVKFLHYWAYAGADLFFVISGFIISGVATRRTETGTASMRVNHALGFLAKRLLRIYPVYWVVLAASALASLWVTIEPGMPHVPLWQNLLLLTRFNWLVPPAWTLFFEVWFYAVVFVLLLAWPRRFYGAMLVLMALQLLMVLTIEKPDVSMFSSALVLEFGLGCGVAFLIAKGRRDYAGWFLCAALAYFLLGAGLTSQHGLLDSGLRTLSFGLGFAFLLYACVASELAGGPVAWRLIRIVGDASFSLYLWHKCLFVVLASLAGGAMINANLPRWLVVLAIVTLTTVFGLVFYRLAERPWVAAANRLVNARFYRTRDDSESGAGLKRSAGTG